MDLLIATRETAELPGTPSEVTEQSEARALLARLPHGPILVPLLSRLAFAPLVLSARLDRAGARAAVGVAAQRVHPRGILLLGPEFSRDLLGAGLPLAGGLREMFGLPVAALGQAKAPEIERLLSDLCLKAHISWSPPSTRAVSARAVARAEDAEAIATRLIERQEWQAAAQALLDAEPLSPRGTNMLGRALLQTGDTSGARKAFERTLAADPGNAIAQRQLGNLGAT